MGVELVGSKTCPLCGSKRFRHRIGSGRWYCRNCRTWFAIREGEAVCWRSPTQKDAVRVEDVLERVKDASADFYKRVILK